MRPALVILLGLASGCDVAFGISTIEPSPNDLSGRHWQAPCNPAGDPGSPFCTCLDTTEQVALGGTTDQRYLVNVRIHGVYEDLHYVGGTDIHDSWVVNGTIAPSDLQSNSLAFDVSAPAATYLINNSIGTNKVDLHAHDFNAAFVVAGDAVVTFRYSAGIDGTERHLDESLHQVTIGGEPWFDGQYAELTVQSTMLQ